MADVAAFASGVRSAHRLPACELSPQAERQLVPPSRVIRATFGCPQGIDTRYTISVDRVMVEVGYPYGDGTCSDI
jgi:hypothetical protein